MDSEQDVYRRLKRCTVDEMLIALQALPRPAAVYNFGGMIISRDNYYPEIALHYARIKCMEDNGWTLEDFYMELEKRAILLMVKDYNDSIEFPQAVIDRAQQLFPNAKFTYARIEFE